MMTSNIIAPREISFCFLFFFANYNILSIVDISINMEEFLNEIGLNTLVDVFKGKNYEFALNIY